MLNTNILLAPDIVYIPKRIYFQHFYKSSYYVKYMAETSCLFPAAVDIQWQII